MDTRWVLAAILVTALAQAAHADSWQPPVTRAMVEEQFALFEPDYRALKAKRMERLRGLEEQLFALQAAGEPMFCSAHMLNETRWLLQSTTQWSRIDKQLWLLGASLQDKDQYFAMNQELHDGSWGVCYDEWFKKLDPMIQAINGMAGKDIGPEHTELEFLQPIDTPPELIDYLDRVRLSDIAATGHNRRDELGAVTSVVAEIVFKERVQDYLARHVQNLVLGPDYVAAFRRYIDEWQDPETGYWGPWYLIDGEITEVHRSQHHLPHHRLPQGRRGPLGPDRRHHARAGERGIPLWLALPGSDDRPQRLRRGADLPAAAGRHMGEAQRAQASAAIGRLLDWSLTESLQPDGAFAAPAGFSSSVSDAQYYGVSLLTKTGYCSDQPAFWTDRSWPEARSTCCRIAERLQGFSAQIPAAEAARRRLAEAYPGCGTAAQGGG